MDVNYFLQREQIERIRADAAACDPSRSTHSELARLYRGVLEDHRRTKPVLLAMDIADFPRVA